jgi:adenine-specific DNA-methyltransferase
MQLAFTEFLYNQPFVKTTVENTLLPIDDKSIGRVKTPENIIKFMISLCPITPHSKILEPACETAPFLHAIADLVGKDKLPDLYAVEIDPAFKRYFIDSHIKFYNEDFLLWSPLSKFDCIIGNPPYGIIGSETKYPIHVLQSHKQLYKRLFPTWYGKYNIYGAFIEKSVHLLKDNGVLVFIIPASWLVLDDFKLLRRFLAEYGKVTVYYLGQCFKGKNVSAVVLKFEKGLRGLALYDFENLKILKPWLTNPNWQGEIIRFENADTLKWEASGIPVGQLFNIHFAARSTEIKRSPYVSSVPKRGYLPVLTGKNLKQGYIDYKNCYAGLYFNKKYISSLREFYSLPHIVVAHTKGAKVVAAYDYKCYPWREEFHLIPKHRLSRKTILKIVDYLNSYTVNSYIQTMYRDFVPHLTLRMLERIPIPYDILDRIK